MDYTIQEVAMLLRITTNKIRFYEKKGLLETEREENGYRVFTEEDVLLIQNILLYREIGISIKDIQGLLKNEDKQNYLKHFYKQWEIINNTIHNLESTRNTLEKLMDYTYEYEDTIFKEKALEMIQVTKEERLLRENWKDQWNFDNWAKSYDSSIRKQLGCIDIYKNYDKLLDSVIETIIQRLTKDREILDIGVGTGNLSEKLYNKGYRPIGVDQSRAMLEVAKTKNPDLKVRWGDFMKLPFENARFDGIVSTYAFHHLNDKEKKLAIDEMMRILTSEGIIVLGDMMFENEDAKCRIYDQLSEQQIEEIEDEYYTNIEWLAKYIEKYQKYLIAKQVDQFCWYIIIY